MLLTQEEAYGMGPALVDAHGNRTELDAESYKVVKTVLRVINGGKAKEDADRALTTGQVAELLGVSSRTVARMVDSGDLPCVGVSEGGIGAFCSPMHSPTNRHLQKERGWLWRSCASRPPQAASTIWTLKITSPNLIGSL